MTGGRWPDLNRRRALLLAAAAPLAATLARPAAAADPSLHIEITEGNAAPLRIALPLPGGAGDTGTAASGPEGASLPASLREAIAADLSGTGLFEVLPADAGPAGKVSGTGDPDSAPDWQGWAGARAEALIAAAVHRDGGRIVLRFRLYDIFAAAPLGPGLQFDAAPADWRRLAHKLADQVYARLTGESRYLDSRIAFVAESGPRTRRIKRIALMDSDGARLRMLTAGDSLVLTPRFHPDGRRLVFVSYERGAPRIALLDIEGGGVSFLPTDPGTMSFAPLFTPDGARIIYSREKGGDTNIWQMDPGSGEHAPLTSGPGIDTAPGISPDGRRMVFESDRSGTQQIYVAATDPRAEPQRISFGPGRYGTPTWSPRGDLIAFTLRRDGLYHIAIMHPDGSGEQLLTSSRHDEGPTWSPNGRVVLFTRQEPGPDGLARLHSVDIGGRNMRPVELKDAASDPAWGPLRP